MKMIGVERNVVIHIVGGVLVAAKSVDIVEGMKHLRAAVVVEIVQGERVINDVILMQPKRRNQDGAGTVMMTRRRREKSKARNRNPVTKVDNKKVGNSLSS
mmetsp:Transcript_5064/g.7333  ORF Transcript_5064/g.7333 Transcript_5064/m.7333 type:complete len:101 (+) Transcript_5064:1379-1681(+)